MYCPECRAEYTAKATICSDCQVALVAELPPEPAEDTPSTLGDESIAMVWSGGDARRHAEVMETLRRENIPARTIRGKDFLILSGTHEPFEVYVTSSFAEKAEEVLNPANALADSAENTDAGSFEISEEDEIHDPQEIAEYRADWHPDDATAEIWSGEDFYMSGMIQMSLRENKIEYRLESDGADLDGADPGGAPGALEKVYVLQEDEARAKEIVREIENAAPPE